MHVFVSISEHRYSNVYCIKHTCIYQNMYVGMYMCVRIRVFVRLPSFVGSKFKFRLLIRYIERHIIHYTFRKITEKGVMRRNYFVPTCERMANGTSNVSNLENALISHSNVYKFRKV